MTNAQTVEELVREARERQRRRESSTAEDRERRIRAWADQDRRAFMAALLETIGAQAVAILLPRYVAPASLDDSTSGIVTYQGAEYELRRSLRISGRWFWQRVMAPDSPVYYPSIVVDLPQGAERGERADALLSALAAASTRGAYPVDREDLPPARAVGDL